MLRPSESHLRGKGGRSRLELGDNTGVKKAPESRIGAIWRYRLRELAATRTQAMVRQGHT